MYFKNIIYGKSYFYLYAKDSVLSLFKYSDSIANANFYQPTPPPDFNLITTQLEKDGFIKSSQYGVSITVKGKELVAKGGFKRAALTKRISYLLAIIATITGVLALM